MNYCSIETEKIDMEGFAPRFYNISVIKIGPEKRCVFVIDKVISKQVADINFEYMRHLGFKLINSDRTQADSLKHLIYTYPKGQWKDELLSYLTDFSRAFLKRNGFTTKKIARIEAHMNLFGDYQLSHKDGNWWTCLLFANNKWHEDWGGELTFYGGKHDEPAVSILPKPGRFVIFDGQIEHRGGVPSKLFYGPRISLAIKFFR